MNEIEEENTRLKELCIRKGICPTCENSLKQIPPKDKDDCVSYCNTCDGYFVLYVEEDSKS